ncbi:uncharacterized protein JCM6883_005015 [Sporobolomyces salmoneus]|uniref:uncharacterized protein n=1 Tax=Sporobolomyces salmoneus TaxID=183962 RepID=UPI003175BD7D
MGGPPDLGWSYRDGDGNENYQSSDDEPITGNVRPGSIYSSHSRRSDTARPAAHHSRPTSNHSSPRLSRASSWSAVERKPTPARPPHQIPRKPLPGSAAAGLGISFQ